MMREGPLVFLAACSAAELMEDDISPPVKSNLGEGSTCLCQCTGIVVFTLVQFDSLLAHSLVDGLTVQPTLCSQYRQPWVLS